MYVLNNSHSAVPLYKSLPNGFCLINHLYKKNKNGQIKYVDKTDLDLCFISKSCLPRDSINKGIVVDKHNEIVLILEDYVEILVNEETIVFASFEYKEDKQSFTSFVIKDNFLHTKRFSVEEGDQVKFSRKEPLVVINEEEYSLINK